jgi:hypothetical protein
LASTQSEEEREGKERKKKANWCETRPNHHTCAT